MPKPTKTEAVNNIPPWLGANCEVSDDCIDPKRRALFVSRAVMGGLIDQLRSEAP